MSSMDNLVLYQKFYDLILYSFPIINRFPKNQKFILGQQIQNCMLDIVKLIVQANKFGNKNRLNNLYYVDIELEKLKLLIRLTNDLGFISYDRYGIFCERFNEIGRILGGWIKASQNQ